MTIIQHRETTLSDASQPTVHIELKELISLMASEVARKVTDELNEKQIAPLAQRVANLELMMARPSPSSATITRWKGAFDALWKLGVIIFAAAQVYRLFFK